MATAPAPGALEAKMASLETQLANVKAQAEADAVNAEHLSQAMEQRYATLAAEHAKVRARGLEKDTEHVHRSCTRSRDRSSRVHPRRDRKRPLLRAAKRPRASRLGAQLHPAKIPRVPIVVVSNLTSEPPLAPPSQAVEERDGLKASLAATNDELAKSKANANALDVSVVQRGASVDRLKVRDRSLSVPRENPRR